MPRGDDQNSVASWSWVICGMKLVNPTMVISGLCDALLTVGTGKRRLRDGTAQHSVAAAAQCIISLVLGDGRGVMIILGWSSWSSRDLTARPSRMPRSDAGDVKPVCLLHISATQFNRMRLETPKVIEKLLHQRQGLGHYIARSSSKQGCSSLDHLVYVAGDGKQ